MTEKCFKVDLERRDSSGLTGIGAEGSPLRTTGPANDKPHLPILRRVHTFICEKSFRLIIETTERSQGSQISCTLARGTPVWLGLWFCIHEVNGQDTLLVGIVAKF